MQRYRRRRQPGGTFFFTLVTYEREPLLTSPLARKLLRDAIGTCREAHPFVIEAFVLLPEHMHCLWRLPAGDSDYSIRWNLIKRTFTHAWLKNAMREGIVSASRHRHGHRGVWQRRFWEHTIRDEEDYSRHADYIHWNPVKHCLVTCPHKWPHSSFHRWLERGRYSTDWFCRCHLPDAASPDFDDLASCE